MNALRKSLGNPLENYSGKLHGILQRNIQGNHLRIVSRNSSKKALGKFFREIFREFSRESFVEESSIEFLREF